MAPSHGAHGGWGRKIGGATAAHGGLSPETDRKLGSRFLSVVSGQMSVEKSLPPAW